MCLHNSDDNTLMFLKPADTSSFDKATASGRQRRCNVFVEEPRLQYLTSRRSCVAGIVHLSRCIDAFKNS